MRSLTLTILLSAVAAAQQTPNAPRYPIDGTVVDHVTNRPIPRALVRLSPVDGPGQLTSLTGENGRFDFSNIPKGKYRLSAQRRSQFPQAFHEMGQYSTAIVVGPGQDATGVVFPLHALGSISCLVLDEDGAPVTQTGVTLFREMVVEGEKRTVQMGNGMTNSLGQFRNSQLAAGTYYLAVQPVFWSNRSFSPPTPEDSEAAPELAYPVTYYGDTADAQAASPITLAEGAAAQVQVTLHPLPAIHVHVTGVRSKNGFGSQLFVHGPGGSQVFVNAAVTGGPDGAYEISGIPAGRYFANMVANRGGRWSQSPLRELDLADGMSIPEQDSSTAGGRLSGQAFFEGGKPPAAPLNLMLIGSGEQNASPTQVGPDGLFAFPNNFALGLYSLQLNSGQYYIKSVAVKGARMEGDKIELTEGVSAKLSLVIAPAESLSHLDGFAQRAGKPVPGAPVPGAMVLLVPADPARSSLFRRDQTDSDGSFTMPFIPPGRYTLLAIDDDGRGLLYKDPAVIRPYLAAGRPITFPLPSKEPAKIEVQPRIR